jgi:putative transposase
MPSLGRSQSMLGSRRIQGALSNLGHLLAFKTIANILKKHGIEPGPERSRKTTWKEFLTRHWEQIVASDFFFTIEVWTTTGLKRFMVLFFMELSTRRVEIAGVASKANGLWMTQIARNVTDEIDGFIKGKRYLIHDRDPLYTQEFLGTLTQETGSVKLPPRSLNLNAYSERFVRTIKESCLEQMILFGEDPLRNSIHQFLDHYHLQRNHQACKTS